MFASIQQRIAYWPFLVWASAFLTLVLLLLNPVSVQATPTVTWTPASVSASILAGETKTVAVSFTASENISSAAVRVVPELQPYVQVNQSKFGPIVKGQTVNLTLIISAPLAGSFEGTIQLQSPGGGTLARPLPVTISIAVAREGVPGWNMPEPAVTGLTAEPERANPGDVVTLRATVSNLGTGKIDSPTLVFLVDDVEISRASVGFLAPGAAVEITSNWQAAGPGQHLVRAELEVPQTDFDGLRSNNFQLAVTRVSGEDFPTAALVFDDIDFGSLQLIPGKSSMVPLKIRNRSFAAISNIPIWFYIDWQSVSNAQIDLASGEEV